MDDSDKLPLKRVEISLTKFNEVAIPHHLDLLRQHKANILKHESAGNWAGVRREQTSAGRVCAQLRALLGELSAVRGRVRESDRTAFDRLTRKARDDTLAAIVDYLETSPLSINRGPAAAAGGAGVAGSAVSTDSVGLVAHAQCDRGASGTEHHDEDVPVRELDEDVVQLQLYREAGELQERERVLEGWSSLQREVHALHAAWRAVHAAVLAQRESVGHTAAQVELAAHNVQHATRHLAIAERLSTGVWSVGGAVCGLAVGGPVGLAAGAKAGALAAVAASALGAIAGATFARLRHNQIDDALAKGAKDD